LKFEEYQTLVNSVCFGKKLPEAIYIHKSSLPEIPSQLATLVSSISKALQLTNEQWDLIKLFKRDFKLSYLSYPDFFTYPYPALKMSHTVDLTKKSSRVASYVDSENPPILHRRELFLHPSHPQIDELKSFTREGESIGLYENTRIIGTLQGWNRVIRRSGHTLDQHGHVVPLILNHSHNEKDESPEGIYRYKTAITRDKLSVPMFALAKAGYLDGRCTVLDYGCGKGDDLRELEAHDIPCIGWDPVLRPDVEPDRCDIVNLGYVINVIEEINERRVTLRTAFELTEKLLAVSAMLGNDSVVEKFRPYKDGVITKARTFQKYYYQSELKEFIESTLKYEAIAAGPGLFFVFKDKLEEQTYLSNRQRTRLNWNQISKRPQKAKSKTFSKSKIEKNEALLKDFWHCCLDLGRAATNDEFEHSGEIRHLFGSHENTLNICREYFDEDNFSHAEKVRRDDLLVYLALDHFGKRQVYRRMPESLQRDIKYHFIKYKNARDEARELLFSVSDTTLIHEACKVAYETLPASQLSDDHSLVFHKDFLNLCPPRLRVYIGCALQLYGDLEQINLIKAHIQSGKVTLMAYEGFDSIAIPLLKERIKIKLQEQDIDFFDYVYGFRPQPLLMKSKLLSKDHPDFKAQLAFDAKLLKIVGTEVLIEHLSAERFDYLLKKHSIRINGQRIIKI
jgi:DNA phosphorothioation-associated putative methyltransferase